MKLTESKLRSIVREEIGNVIQENRRSIQKADYFSVLFDAGASVAVLETEILSEVVYFLREDTPVNYTVYAKTWNGKVIDKIDGERFLQIAKNI